MEDVVAKVAKSVSQLAEPYELRLLVQNPGMVRELLSYPEGGERDAFALNALRIGMLALRQAQGRIDGDAVRTEGERILGSLEQHLQEHKRTVQENVRSVLKEYFDPKSGRFNERVTQLVQDGGDLQRVIKAQVGREDSELALTLASYFGPSSPLMKVLDPNDSEGVVRELGETVKEVLADQSRIILSQFSLDNPTSALARLVKELKDKHGELESRVQEKVDDVVGEFSLDDEDSALSRLVGRMEAAQQKINDEFSLDEANSALARMKRELQTLIEGQNKVNEAFRNDIRETLAAMNARRSELQKTTRHGLEFEGEVLAFVERDCAMVGDLMERTGMKPGLIKHCKVGDGVINMGPEREAAGARIVIEAKQEAGIDLADALAELKRARDNRGASVGLFVYSRRIAPEGLPALSRYGNDVVVIWDLEDTVTDIYLSAALSVCRALSVRDVLAKPEAKADLSRMKREIFEVEKQVEALEEIRRGATTIRTSAEKIEDRGRIIAQALGRSVSILASEVQALMEAPALETGSAMAASTAESGDDIPF